MNAWQVIVSYWCQRNRSQTTTPYPPQRCITTVINLYVIVLSYLVLAWLTSSHVIWPPDLLTSSQLRSSHLLSHGILSNLTSPHLSISHSQVMSSQVTLPYLILSYLILSYLQCTQVAWFLEYQTTQEPIVNVQTCVSYNYTPVWYEISDGTMQVTELKLKLLCMQWDTSLGLFPKDNPPRSVLRHPTVSKTFGSL